MVTCIKWIRTLASPAIFLLLVSTGIMGQPVTNPFLPAIAIEELQISDRAGYATLVGEINQSMQDKHGVPLFLRAYGSAGLSSSLVEAFALSPSATFENLADNRRRFLADPDFGALRERMDRLGIHGRKTYLKAVRFDGTNTPGWLLNNLIVTQDEAGLLHRIDRFFSLLESQGLEAPMINVFRVITGESAFTHLVSINAASEEAIGKIMDALAATFWSFEFSNGSDSTGVVVKSTVYQELAP